ncbi:hypothetical protein [Natronobiforma cellulositropha]|uniref:hypothetical protein n=1 Tax=Natronobiforma cellulositropha TaxID=1679076 RepID=UPI0021D5DF57|nr:hypothetical protein [Natronobiforma cellulositropha]
MSWLFWIAVCAIVLAAAGYALVRTPTEASPRPVLPAQYDPANYAVDPSTVAGWCVSCETQNEVGYRFCENCSAELPQGVNRRQAQTRYWFSRRE